MDEERNEGDNIVVIDLGFDGEELMAEVQKISYHLEILTTTLLDIVDGIKQP